MRKLRRAMLVSCKPSRLIATFCWKKCRFLLNTTLCWGSGALRLTLIGSVAFSAVSSVLYSVTWLGRVSTGCSWSELLGPWCLECRAVLMGHRHSVLVVVHWALPFTCQQSQKLCVLRCWWPSRWQWRWAARVICWAGLLPLPWIACSWPW